jgi:hypothetical protein
MAKVTPIRADVKVPAPKKKRDRKSGASGEQLENWQSRLGHAAALARAMALALDGKVLEFEIEAAEGCLGVAGLLDTIRMEMYEIAEEGR